jgi:hypothetical protein
VPGWNIHWIGRRRGFIHRRKFRRAWRRLAITG